MGKALYRKYRSKSFDEIIGQKHITDTLKNALKKDALSHAYLFTGPRGSGKTSIARILAYAINDIDYNEEATHLDIIEIDAASNRRIDEIRDLRDKVHIAPSMAKYKVYIIDEVHMLTREAFNALLKTLEEPPKHAIFILATTEAHKVPDTIISRTQRFTFKPFETEQAVNHLRMIADKEKLVINDEALKLLAKHGRGSFRDSISMLDQLSGLAKTEYSAQDVELLLGLPTGRIIENIIDAVASNNHTAVFDTVKELKERGIDAARAAKAISDVARDGIIAGELILSYPLTLQLLKNLLSVTDQHGDFLDLELALLDVMDANKSMKISEKKPSKVELDKNKPQEKTNTQDQDTNDKLEQELGNKDSKTLKIVEAKSTTQSITQIESIEKNPVESANERTEEPKQSGENNADDRVPENADVVKKQIDVSIWNKMLADVKKDHNTLHGLLRMCEPAFVDGSLLLTFRFGFHKKQIESSKNKPLMKLYLTKYFGGGSFKAAVSNDSTETSVKQQDKNKDASPATPDAVQSVSNIFEGAQLLD